MLAVITDSDIISAKDVGAMLGLNRITVIKYTREGHIPGVRIGYVYRYSRREIAKMQPGNQELGTRGNNEESDQTREAAPLQTGTY